MTTVVFIHGTGVREPRYGKSLEQVKEALHARRPDVKLLPCAWGDELGAAFHHNHASIPNFVARPATRGLANPSVSDENALLMLWDLLYQDPLYELRTLALMKPDGAQLVPGRLPSGRAVDQKLRQLTPELALAAALDEGQIAAGFDAARTFVCDSLIYTQLIQASAINQSDLSDAVARALVATAIMQAETAAQLPAVSTDADLRDRIVDALSAQLSPSAEQTRGLKPVEWVKNQLAGLAQRFATSYVEERRGGYTDVITPGIGDILLYQGRGKPIREYVRSRIEQAAAADPSVVVLAHSLGGIIAVDILAGEPIPAVKLLITAGSQAPFLYEINALQSLRYDEPLPDHFPHWLNIYDTNDFLSYVAAGVFNRTGDLRVEDVEVKSRQPFPRAHSSYWTNSQVWDAITRRLI
jgi:hypothetical protein